MNDAQKIAILEKAAAEAFDARQASRAVDWSKVDWSKLDPRGISATFGAPLTEEQFRARHAGRPGVAPVVLKAAAADPDNQK